MVPMYQDGDHVVTFNWFGIKKKDVIVFRLGRRYLIKRVDTINDEQIVVSGDNKSKSIKLKPIVLDQVVGRVVLKYQDPQNDLRRS